MLKLNSILASNIAKKIGLTIEEIRYENPTEIALIIEQKQNKKLSFSSEFPFIGRGNILRDGIVTSQNINKDIDRILGL